MRHDHIKEYVRSSLWVIPTISVLLAAVGAQLAIALDATGDAYRFAEIVFPGDADSARAVLSTISASMISFTGIVFTITIVALQLASQQFSPRILRTFVEDRQVQVALGIFVATFTFSFSILRQVGADRHPVPRLSVVLALLLVLASVIAFLGYLDHMTRSVRISYIMGTLGEETRAIIERSFPPDADARERPPEGEPTRHVVAPHPGIMNEIHRDQLVSLAHAHGCRFVVEHPMGEFVPEGASVIEVRGNGEGPSDEELLRCIDLGRERTMEQDAAFGFRQLVDIAEKALSPALNDPTTAVQALDQIHDLLRRLVRLPLPRWRSYGEGRLFERSITWDGFLLLGVSEVRTFGHGHVQIARRLRALLQDLERVAPPERKQSLEQQLELLDRSIERAFSDQHDRHVARKGDEQGLG